MLTTNRMQEILIDAELDRERQGYTTEENNFRDKIDTEIAEAKARGETLEFTAELP